MLGLNKFVSVFSFSSVSALCMLCTLDINNGSNIYHFTYMIVWTGLQSFLYTWICFVSQQEVPLMSWNGAQMEFSWSLATGEVISQYWMQTRLKLFLLLWVFPLTIQLLFFFTSPLNYSKNVKFSSFSKKTLQKYNS